MPTYGKTGVGASWITSEIRYVVRTITLPGGESVVGFNAYLRSQGAATAGWRLALYDKTDDSLDYQSDNMAGFTDTVGAWRTATYSAANPIADTYWLVVAAEVIAGGANTIQVAFDTITADTANYQFLAYTGTWPTLQNPLPIADDIAGSGTHDVSIYLETSAGGVIFTRTLSDSVNTNDAAAREARMFRQVPLDSVALQDILMRSQQHGRVAADSVAISDDVRRAARMFRQITDTATPNDSVLRFAQMFRRIVDDAAVTDSLAVTLTLGGVIIVTRILQDNLNVADVVQRAVRMYRREADAVDVRDGTWYSARAVRTVTETLAIADSVARMLLLTRTVTDQATAADAALRFALLNRLAHEDIDARDSLASQITFAVQLIGFVLQSMRMEPVVLALDAAATELSFARAQPILMEMRNL